jgi:hypothetical protein
MFARNVLRRYSCEKIGGRYQFSLSVACGTRLATLTSFHAPKLH